MELLKAIIIGLIQGFTEFLPISSSGHLVLSKYFLNFGEVSDISFEIFVHLGTLIAVLIYFRNDLLDLLKSVIYFRNPNYKDNRKIILWLLIVTLITGIVGYICKGFIEILLNPLLVAIMIAITGGILFISDKIKEKELNSSELNIKKSLIIGLGQALAITPGISRSGTTITFALLTGLKRKHAATFSFLLSIPAVLGANILEYKTHIAIDTSQMLIYLAGFFAAFVSGYLVINLLIKLIVKAKLCYFSYYCWTISAICIGLILYGV